MAPTTAGNLVGTSTGDTYTWDDYGRLTSATVDGVAATYGYDSADIRTTVDGVGQVWDRTGLPTLISAGTDTWVHTRLGPARSGTDWLLNDAVGSIRAITDNTGQVTASQAFTVFGEPLTPQPEAFGFAGEQTDTTGLVHLRARQYDPGTGRFISVDPQQPGGPSTAGWGLYGYAAANPTTWSDPTGEAVLVEYGLKFAAGAALAAVISLWTCQEEFSWGGPFSQGLRNVDLGCTIAASITGGLFAALGLPAAAGAAAICALGAADGTVGHALNAALTDADASIKGAIRDGGIGCAIALLTLGLGNLFKRFRPGGTSGIDDGTPPPKADESAPGTNRGDPDDTIPTNDSDGGTKPGFCKSFSASTRVLMADGTSIACGCP